jgi:exopolysaccharide biosynthesis polyprenyl glycosylphosphotransferase
MSNRAKTILLLLIDMLILVLSLSIILFIRKLGHPSETYLTKHYQLFSFVFPFWILMYFIEGLYTLKTYNPANLPISILRSTVLSIFISVVIIYVAPLKLQGITPKTNLLLVALLTVPLLYFWRRFFFHFFAGEKRLRNTFIVGSLETLKIVHHEINKKPHLGYKIIASMTPDEHPVLIPEGIELIAVERNMTKESGLYQQIFALLGSGIEIMDLAKFAEEISGKIPINAIDESWFIDYCGHQDSRSYDVIKNIIDRFVAILLFIFLIPIAIAVIPILLIVHGKPIFFKQVRTGLNNKPFTLYKLRTMVIDAEKNGAQWARPGDARITPLGKILRKSRLDELPQLINILKGEMSLVGPRPERPEIIAKELSPNIRYYDLRHLVKPGVTGWAQVTFRYGFSQEDSKEKLQFDLFYVKNRDLWLDLLVIIKTIKTVLTGAGQ